MKQRMAELTSLACVLLLVVAASAQAQVRRPDAESSGGPARERRRVQRLEQAKELLSPPDPASKPDFAQGLRLLQSILEDGRQETDELGAEDVFLGESDDGDAETTRVQKPARSLKSAARRLIGSLSAEGRQVYETLFGAGAKAQLDAALTVKNWSGVEDVARRWLHTKAGLDATDQLGARALDLGDPLGAARRWSELWESPANRSARNPDLSLRLALALRLAGDAVRSREVLNEVPQAAELSPLPTSVGRGVNRVDWPMSFGDAARSGFAAAAVPTERPDWSRSLLGIEAIDRSDANDTASESPDDSLRMEDGGLSPTLTRGAWGAVRVEARSRIEQARQADQPIMPAGSAIVVNGTVVSRTLSQVRAWRLSDGEPLWNSAVADPVVAEMLGKRRRGRSDPSERTALESFVHQRLWEDRGLASLSSDGEFVFSLHDRANIWASPQMAWRGLLLPQEFNSLMATELATGRLAWEIGGPRGDQEMASAGLFFLGPPLPWRGRLFVLAEDGPEVRLVVLNALDGRMMWTQVLVAADPQWFGSRHDSALTPTVVGELVICPTGSGSVVAVDPVRRELAWQQNYREQFARPVPTRRFDFHASPVESFWSQSEVLSSGNRLLLAAPDHSDLLCLDASDGRLIWKRGQTDGMFLAGVTKSAVLVVGRTELQSWQLEDGEPTWSRPVPLAPPSGRGVLIDGVLHQPNIRGELVSIDAVSGQVLATTKPIAGETGRDGVPTYGNLLAASGRIVSQSAESLVVFPALGDLQRELTERLAANPNDASALERRGRMSLSLGDRERGLSDLRQAVALRPSASAKRQVVDLLMSGLHGDLNDSKLEAIIRELEPLIDDAEQRLRFVRLRAEHWSRGKQWMLAAREFLKLADAWEPTGVLEVNDGSSSSRQDRWIGARLAALRESMSAAERSQFDAELQSRLKRAIEGDGTTALRAFVAMFGWSDAALAARVALIEKLDPRKHRHSFEASLFGLRQRGNVSEQAVATARLAQHWLTLHQVELSRPLIDDLATRFTNEVCLEKQSGRELAERWRAEFRDRLDVSWPTGKLTVSPAAEVVPANGKATVVGWSAPPDSLHELWRLEFDPTLRALVGRDSANRIQWQAQQPFDDEVFPAQTGRTAQVRGRYAIMNLGNRFLVLDTVAAPGTDRMAARLLWQQVLYDRRVDQDLTPATGQAPSVIGGTPAKFQLTDSSGRRLGKAAIINDEVIGYQIGSRLFAAELPTGESLWSFEGLPPGCDLSGDEQVLVATAPDSGEAFVFDVLDGRLLARRENVQGVRLTTIGRNRLTWSAETKECELHLLDTVTGRDVRRERLEANSRPCLSLLDTMAVFEPSGRWRLWRLSDGAVLLDAKVPPVAKVSHIVALRDRERWLLFTHTEEPAEVGKLRARVDPLHFTHWKINGPAFAFDRATGRPLWSTAIAWQGVNAAQPADSPLLLFAGTVHRPPPAVIDAPRVLITKLQVEVLDRRTGQLVSLADRTLSANHAEQRPNIETKTVDLLIDQTVLKNNSTQIERRMQRATFEP